MQKKLESLFSGLRTNEGFHMNPRADEIPQRLAKAILKLMHKLNVFNGNSDQDVDVLESKLLLNSELSRIIKQCKLRWKERLIKKVKVLTEKVFLFRELIEEQHLLQQLQFNQSFYYNAKYKTGNIIHNVIQLHKNTSQLSKIISLVFQETNEKMILGSKLFTPVEWIVKEFTVWEAIFSCNIRVMLFRDSLFIFEESISAFLFEKRKEFFKMEWEKLEIQHEKFGFQEVGEKILRLFIRQFCKQRFFEAIETNGMRCQKYRQALRRIVK